MYKRPKQKKSTLVWTIVLIASEFATSAYAVAQSPASTESEVPILAPGGAHAAIGLKARAWCSPTQLGKTVANLSWIVAPVPGNQQRLDLTMYWDGFQKGNFSTIGPITYSQSSVKSDELEVGIDYYWRVLTLTSEGWVPSETARAAVPACPVDRPHKEGQ